MALPANGSTWPPVQFNRAYSAMSGWDAWYAGDPARLTAFYQNSTAQRTSLASAGVLGMAKSFLWGRKLDPSTSGSRLHVPVAADIARTSADLLFAEPPTFLIGEGKSPTQDLLADVFGNAHTAASLLESAEIQSALGGCYLRLVWDVELFEHVRLDPVDADAAIPEWRYGQLAAVTFWETLPAQGKDGQVWRHLERHSPGIIEHALYMGSTSDIGVRVPLPLHPEMDILNGVVNLEGIIETGIKGNTAFYVPNILPNRKWRTDRALAPLGRSDFDQIEPLLDAADEAWSSLMRELRLSKARAFVDESMLDTGKPGQGSTFDSEAEIFTTVSGIGSMENGTGISTFQPELRIASHRDLLLEILQTALRSAGYSAASFSEDPQLNGGAKTATQVNTERELSHRTRDKKIQYWKPALEQAATSALELEQLVYGVRGIVMDQITVRFPTRTGVDPVSMANTLNMLSAAGAISTEQKVRRLNPNWDSDDVNKEVKMIRSEAGTPVPDPTKVGADPGTPTPAERAAAALAAKK